MCGIAGWAGDLGSDAAALDRMTDAILHRGPDSDGRHVEPGRCAIGFRRLSIIDLAGGAQPLASEDGRVVATCNGEIYNFKALRAELESLGHTFRTGSDCETIPHAYEQWGTDFVSHLRGMFAIALWDSARAAARARARPARQEAALLRRAPRRAALRLRAAGDPGARVDRRATRSGRAAAVHGPPVRAAAPQRLRGHRQARTGRAARLRERRRDRQPLLVARARPSGDDGRGGARGGRRAAARGHRAAARRRRAARRLPLWRHRLVAGRLLHGRGGRADAHVLDRLRRRGHGRGRARGPGRAGLRHRARADARRGRRRRHHARDHPLRRRAVRRPLLPADLSAVADDQAPRHGGVVR